jgi:hypothetical protein
MYTNNKQMDHTTLSQQAELVDYLWRRAEANTARMVLLQPTQNSWQLPRTYWKHCTECLSTLAPTKCLMTLIHSPRSMRHAQQSPRPTNRPPRKESLMNIDVTELTIAPVEGIKYPFIAVPTSFDGVEVKRQLVELAATRDTVQAFAAILGMDALANRMDEADERLHTIETGE